MKTPDFTTASELELCRYFITKFKAIPDKMWAIGNLANNTGPCCVLGHCGLSAGGEHDYSNPTLEAIALGKLLNHSETIRGEFINRMEFWPGDVGREQEELVSNCWRLNDTKCGEYNQPTPRARILAALRDIQTKLEAA